MLREDSRVTVASGIVATHVMASTVDIVLLQRRNFLSRAYMIPIR
jgi:hypothetical protein